MKNLLLIAFLTTGLLFTTANAEEHEPLSGQITETFFRSLPEAYQDTAEKMDAVTIQLMGLLDPNSKIKFKKAQQAWTKYMKAECSLVTDYFDMYGIASPMYQECLISMTNDRTEALKYHIFINTFGDVSKSYPFGE
jgi:uncharacterized protein YecT (DUF1311 family)